MKLSVILFLCFTGLVPVAVSILLTIPHQYALIKTALSWPVAQNYCREMYTDLAIILSHTDWLRLNKEITSKGEASGTMWVGLWNDVNSWRWSLGDLPLNSVTYTNWCFGQPNNVGGHETCGAMDSYGHWWDVPCTELRPFVCYDVNFSGKFISITSLLLTWFEARTYCRQYHTDLASSLDSSDQGMLNQLVSFSVNPWIGLYRDSWKWSDGTNATDLSWAPGQPDNYGGNENCARVYNDQFFDVPCTNQYYFFCHTNFPTRSQTLRLVVESDGSVFDCAVNLSILDQIKQKLEKYGMLENTTVTWSVQSDGNIFYKKKKGQL